MAEKQRPNRARRMVVALGALTFGGGTWMAVYAQTSPPSVANPVILLMGAGLGLAGILMLVVGAVMRR